MTLPIPHQDQGPIADIREGMPVRDARNEELGSVAEVTMGDPEAVTGAGQEFGTADSMLSRTVASAFGGSRLPPAVAERYLRTGYLRIRRGMVAADAYVGAEQVDAVRDGTVHLRLTRDGIAEPA